MFKQNIDLEITSLGILDNSNISKIGLIKWEDISLLWLSLGIIDKTLLLYVSNPNVYLEKINHNFFIDKVLQQNKKIYGTCFTINLRNYKISAEELGDFIKNEYQKHKTL